VDDPVHPVLETTLTMSLAKVGNSAITINQATLRKV
jgi:hypothetical protein